LAKAHLPGQALRMSTATAMTECSVLRIEKNAMTQALRREHTFADLFVAYLLTRNIRSPRLARLRTYAGLELAHTLADFPAFHCLTIAIQ
jgi:CRP-like cAMP-binding protein